MYMDIILLMEMYLSTASTYVYIFLTVIIVLLYCL